MRRPTIVLFQRTTNSVAQPHPQVLRLRAALDSIGVTFVDQIGGMVTYKDASGQVLWVSPRDSLPIGYLFLHRGGLTFIRYGLVPDTVLRAAVDVWWPPAARQPD